MIPVELIKLAEIATKWYIGFGIASVVIAVVILGSLAFWTWKE